MKSSLRQCGSFSLLGGMAIGAGLMYLVGTGLRSGAHRAVTPISVVPRRPSVPDWVLAERARLEIWRTTAKSGCDPDIRPRRLCDPVGPGAGGRAGETA